MKGKRPKVRYVVEGIGPGRYRVIGVKSDIEFCQSQYRQRAERVAAALNFYEAHKRGEL